MNVLAYLARRLLQLPVVLLFTTLIIFLVVRATPGDPAAQVLGVQTSPAAVEALREQYDLDKPLYQQYVIWLGNVMQGDLGKSIRLNRDVTQMIAERLPVSLQLAGSAILLALLISIPLGIAAAIWRNTWVDYLATGYMVAGFAIPNFALALILIFVFSIRLDWFPITGIGSSTTRGVGLWAFVSPFILPVIALGTMQTAIFGRFLRSSMIDVLSQDYIRTARSKGLKPPVVMLIHALKNALIPFVTVVAIQFGYLIGIQITIEFIFAIPGMGLAVLTAVVNRDFPVIQGFTLVIAVFVLFANLVADVLYAFLDPRIRY